jgi:replicative DNA helicase Mcm
VRPCILQRLAEASARIRLSEEITVEDADRAATLHQRCLEDVGIDPETGEFDIDIVETGDSMIQRKRIKTVSTVIEDLEREEQFDAGAPYDEISSFAGELGMTPEQIDHALDKICQKGEAYRPQGGDNPTYRLT